MKDFFVYILTNKNRTTLYIGITNDLKRRLEEHRNKEIHGFTAQYNLNRLVYFETFSDPQSAIAREKQLKGWLRKKKIQIIEKQNPHWQDLSVSWFDDQN